MVLFENDYLSVHLLEEEKIILGHWKPTSPYFTTDLFKENMQTWLEEVKKYKDINVLADARTFTFTIEPETQSWVNENIIGLYPEYGVKKLGFLVSPDIFAQVSIEQTIDEKEQAFEVRYFEEEAEAKAWLAS